MNFFKRITHLLLTFTLLSALAATGSNCLGRGLFPDVDDSSDDGLPGRFVREIGPENLKYLLASPYAGPDFGIPINHMLLMLDQVELDKLIGLIQQASGIEDTEVGTPYPGAWRAVVFLNAAKRFGCERTGNFDFTVDFHLECKLTDFDYIDLMSTLVENTEDITKMARMINQESIEESIATPTDDDESDEIKTRRYLEKVAFLAVYLDSPQKLTEMVNGTIDARDVVYTIDQFDNEGCFDPTYTTQTTCETNGEIWYEALDVPVPIADILDGSQLAGLNKLVSLMQQVDDSTKLYTMINGQRTTADDETEDTNQREYIANKLIPVLEGNDTVKLLPPADADVQTWILKLSTMVNVITDLTKMVDMVADFQTIHITNLVQLVDDLNSPALATPNENSITTVGTLVNEIDDTSKMVTILEEADAPKMADLVNDLSRLSRTDDNGDADLTAAGQKMANIIDQISGANDPHCSSGDDITHFDRTTCEGASFVWLNNNLGRLANTIDDVTEPEKLSTLIDYLSIANAGKMGDLVNDVTTWVNVPVLINALDSLPATSVLTMGYVLDNVGDSGKLVYMVDNVTPVSMSELVNGVATGSPNDDSGSPDDTAAGQKMTGLIDNTTHVGKIRLIIDHINARGGTMNNLYELVNDLRIVSQEKTAEVVNTVAAPCSDPNLTTNADCTAGGEIWTNFEHCVDNTATPLCGGEPTFLLSDNLDRMAYLMLNVGHCYVDNNMNDEITSEANDPDCVAIPGQHWEPLPEKMSRLVDELTTANAAKLGDIINDVIVWGNTMDTLNLLYPPTFEGNLGSDPNPDRRNSIRSMAYTVDNINVSSKINYLINNIDSSPSGLANLSTLVNEVATTSQIDDGGGGDLTAAGQKLVAAMNVLDDPDTDSTAVDRMIFVINEITNVTQMSDLVNAIRISSSDKVGVLVQDTTGVDFWDDTAGLRNTSTGGGKIVNILEYVTDPAQLAVMIDDINSSLKLSSLVNGVTNSSNLVALTNSAINQSALDNMVLVVNGIGGPADTYDDIPKLVYLVDNMTLATETVGTIDPIAEHDLAAYLMLDADGPQAVEVDTATPTGIGPTNMVDMLINIGNCTGATAYTRQDCITNFGTWDSTDTGGAQVMTELINSQAGNPLCYQEACPGTYPEESGMARLISAGAMYEGTSVCYDPSDYSLQTTHTNAGACGGAGFTWGDVPVPGLTGDYMGLVVNQYTGAGSTLATLISDTEMSQVMIVLGCADGVTANNFNDVCSWIGE